MGATFCDNYFSFMWVIDSFKSFCMYHLHIDITFSFLDDTLCPFTTVNSVIDWILSTNVKNIVEMSTIQSKTLTKSIKYIDLLLMHIVKYVYGIVLKIYRFIPYIVLLRLTYHFLCFDVVEEMPICCIVVFIKVDAHNFFIAECNYDHRFVIIESWGWIVVNANICIDIFQVINFIMFLVKGDHFEFTFIEIRNYK